MTHAMTVMHILGVDFSNMSFDEACTRIVDMGARREKALIVTPNVDHVVRVHMDPEFAEAVRFSSLRLADGMPIVWLSKLCHYPGLPERVTGADLLPAIAKRSQYKGVSIFLLGGADGVAEKAAQAIILKYDKVSIVGTLAPSMGFENDENECQRIVTAINDVRPDILFVALGSPKQELWAYRYLDALDVGPVLGVGAAFDFMSGTIMRAPKIFQRMGLEWLWRVCLEPRRLLLRYLRSGTYFFYLAFRECLKRLAGR